MQSYTTVKKHRQKRNNLDNNKFNFNVEDYHIDTKTWRYLLTAKRYGKVACDDAGTDALLKVCDQNINVNK